MCLIIVLSRVVEGWPLVVAANRDEQYERPTSDVGVLADEPRIIGGRDEVAGGTWLATNANGIVVALANQPSPGGRDPSKRSRGEIPVALARHDSAEEAAESFVASFRAEDYNACGVLVGDREALFYIELREGQTGSPEMTELPPGLHVLTNGPMFSPSAKADYVRSMLRGDLVTDPARLIATLESVLANHDRPPANEHGEFGGRDSNPCCVHGAQFGTRSSSIITVGMAGSEPQVRVTDGPPCTSTFKDVSQLFSQQLA